MANGGTGGTLFPVLKNEARAVRTALWLRPAAFCTAAALAAALLATVDALLPRGSLAWLPDIETGTVTELLKLLASGMLTVAAVTLSVLMLVLSLAAGQVSPRAVPSVMADVVTQNALGTFLATFVYALAALLFIGFGVVTGPGGAALIFLGALLLALNAVRYMVQWTHHVAQVLKINRMVHRIHHHGTEVLAAYLDSKADTHCERLSLAGNYLGSLLTTAGCCPPGEYPPPSSADGRLQFVRTDFASMLQRAFRPVMRDAAGHAEVIFAIMRVLRSLAAQAVPDYLECIAAEAQRVEHLGQAALQLEADKQALRRMAEELRAIAAGRRA